MLNLFRLLAHLRRRKKGRGRKTASPGTLLCYRPMDRMVPMACTLLTTKRRSRFYSPLVKNIAKEENITVAELETIPGSGLEGRLTKKDLLDFVQHRKLGVTVQAIQKSKRITTPFRHHPRHKRPRQSAVAMRSSRWIACVR